MLPSAARLCPPCVGGGGGRTSCLRGGWVGLKPLLVTLVLPSLQDSTGRGVPGRPVARPGGGGRPLVDPNDNTLPECIAPDGAAECTQAYYSPYRWHPRQGSGRKGQKSSAP